MNQQQWMKDFLFPKQLIYSSTPSIVFWFCHWTFKIDVSTKYERIHSCEKNFKTPNLSAFNKVLLYLKSLAHCRLSVNYINSYGPSVYPLYRLPCVCIENWPINCWPCTWFERSLRFISTLYASRHPWHTSIRSNLYYLYGTYCLQ